MTEESAGPTKHPAVKGPGELFSLQGKTVVLTGASGFLGSAMAEALLASGARLIAVGRSKELEVLGTKWSESYGSEKVSIRKASLDDPESLDDMINTVASSEDRIDVVVNNAHQLDLASGFNSPSGSFESMDSRQWTRHMDGGLWWAARLVQGFGHHLKRSSGSVINISSMYGLVAPSPLLYEGTDKINPPGYSVAKAAMLALTRYLASYWGVYGVRANAILPGPFSNVGGESENSVDEDDPFLQRLADRTALGRTGRPEELAGALLFLASEASSYVTGHALVVDGGWTAI